MDNLLNKPAGFDPATGDAVASGNKKWYAAQVRANGEKSVAAALDTRDIEAYLPTYKENRRWSDRWKEIELPLFPGYVFCRIDPEKRMSVEMTPGVVRLAGSGRAPSPVDESEMHALRKLAASDLPRRPATGPSVGETVEILGGPLDGISGVLERIGPGRKLIIGITLLRRAVAVEFDEAWVAVANLPNRAKPAA